MNPNQHAFGDQAKRGVCHAINARRDLRPLEAAHQAPSVGCTQPLNFLIVRDRALHKRLHAHFKTVREDHPVQRRSSSHEPRSVLACSGRVGLAEIPESIKNSVQSMIFVVIDRLTTGAAKLIAAYRNTDVKRIMLAERQGTEPGWALVLDELGIIPVLHPGFRLGEGSSAALASRRLAAASGIDFELYTVDEPGLVHPDRPGAHR